MDMRVKYGLIAGLLTAAVVLLTGCQEVEGERLNSSDAVIENTSKDQPDKPGFVSTQAEETEKLPGIKIDVDHAEAVSVYYGSVCYSYYSENPDVIKQIADLFHGFTLEEAPDGELDHETTFQVYFSADEAQIAAVNVDKNGMFYLPEEHKFYRISKGTFQFAQLEAWYQESMNSSGFENLRPLVS